VRGGVGVRRKMGEVRPMEERVEKMLEVAVAVAVGEVLKGGKEERVEREAEERENRNYDP